MLLIISVWHGGKQKQFAFNLFSSSTEIAFLDENLIQPTVSSKLKHLLYKSNLIKVTRATYLPCRRW